MLYFLEPQTNKNLEFMLHYVVPAICHEIGLATNQTITNINCTQDLINLKATDLLILYSIEMKNLIKISDDQELNVKLFIIMIDNYKIVFDDLKICLNKFKIYSIAEYCRNNIRMYAELLPEIIPKITWLPNGFSHKLVEPEIDFINHPKDIDIFVYGALGPRRNYILDQLRTHNLRIVHVHCNKSISEINQLINRSRLILDIYYYAYNKPFNFYRNSYLIANKVVFVTESPDQTEDHIEHIYNACYIRTIDLVLEVLKKTQSELRTHTNQLYNWYSEHYNFQKFVKPIFNSYLIDNQIKSSNISAKFVFSKALYGLLDKYIDVTEIVKAQFLKSDDYLIIPKNTKFNQYFSDPYPGISKELIIKMTNGQTHIIGEPEPLSNDIIIKYDDFVHNYRLQFKKGNIRRIVDSFMIGNEIDLLKLRLKYYHDVVDYFVIAESERTHQNQPKNLILPNLLNNPPDWLDVRKIVGMILTGDEIDKNQLGQTGITEHQGQKMVWGIENQQRESLCQGYEILFEKGLINDLDLIVLSDLDEFPDRELLKYTRDHYQQRVLFHQDNHYYSFKWLNQNRLYGSIMFPYWDYQNKIFPKLQHLRDFRYGYSRVRYIGGWHCSYFGGLSKVTEKLNNIVEGPAFYNKCQKIFDNLSEDITTKILLGIDPYGRKSEQLISNSDWTRLPPFAFEIEPELSDYLINLRNYKRILIFDAVASRGYVFKDICDSLYEVIKSKGYSVEITNNLVKKSHNGSDLSSELSSEKSDLYLILGLHTLPIEHLPQHFIAYQLEQLPHSSLVNDAYLANLKQATRIWDYSQTNIIWLRERKINAVYCPVGYSPCLEFNHNLMVDNSNSAKKVIFYGSLNSRRTQMIETLQMNKIPIEIYKNNCWGQERIKLLSQTLMVINWHYFDDGLMELSRLAPLLSNRILVISEKAKEPEINLILKDAVVLVDNLEELVAKIKYYLEHSTEAQKIADQGYLIFKNNLNLSKRLPIYSEILT